MGKVVFSTGQGLTVSTYVGPERLKGAERLRVEISSYVLDCMVIDMSAVAWEKLARFAAEHPDAASLRATPDIYA